MISTAWRNELSNNWDHDTRLYFNPRGIAYPAISDTLTYSQDEGLGGNWCASGGTAQYLIDCTQPTIVSCMAKVQAASNYIFRWYTATTNAFSLGTNGSSQIFGGFNNGTAYFTTAVTVGSTWHKIDLAIISNQMTLWVDNTKYGPTAIGAIAAQLPILYVNAATAKIRRLRILKYAATEANVTSMYSGVKNAEIYGDFAKRSVLYERCNITRFYNGYTLDASDGYRTTTANVTLKNHTGAFTDDIYATFDPTADDFNGTSAQEYLQSRTEFWIEEYYQSAYSAMQIFNGYSNPGAFARSSNPKAGSDVQLKLADYTAELSRRVVRKARYWADLHIADGTTDASSLFHQIASLGTKKEVYNYLTNSCFENPTISNSWTVSGGTLTRTSGGLCGSYYGALATTGAIAGQIVTIPVSSGERFTAQVLINGNAIIRLAVYDLTGTTVNGTTYTDTTVTTAEGWKLAYTTHDVVSSSSDRIRVYAILTGSSIGLDSAMLTYGGVKYGYILNSNDGTSGVSNYTQAMSGTYDIVGVHTDTVSYHHPWAIVEPGEKVWELLSQIADACAPKYVRITREGVLTLASNLGGVADTTNGTIEGSSGAITDLLAGNQSNIANKIKVQGANIKVKPNVECMFTAQTSGLTGDSINLGAGFLRTIANGDYCPDIDESSDGYEALYSENKPSKTAGNIPEKQG